MTVVGHVATPRGTVFTTHVSPLSPLTLQVFYFRLSCSKPCQTHSVSPESILSLRQSWLNPFLFIFRNSPSTASLLKINNAITEYQNLLSTLPQSHTLHSLCLLFLAIKRLICYEFSNESKDLDESISHSTEAMALLVRSQKSEQPGDLKHAINYLRHLQDHSPELSDLTRSHIKAYLLWALAVQVKLESVDPVQDIGEMVTLCRELLNSGVSESLLIHTVKALAGAIGMTHVPFEQPLADEAIECLREAKILFPTLDEVRLVLALSLHVRFNLTQIHHDYEEAMSILDEMTANRNGNVELAMGLAGSLARCRFISHSKPEYLEVAILRIRTYLTAISSEHPDHRAVVKQLADLEKIRLRDFRGRSGRQEGTNAKVVDFPHLAASLHWQMAQSNIVEFPLPIPEKGDPVLHFALTSMLTITDITDIEKAVEYCRFCITSPHSDIPLARMALGRLLHQLFCLTGNTPYLHESITVLYDLINMPGVPIQPHKIALQLIDCLRSRFKLFKESGDSDEIMELFAVAATDTSTDAPSRFPTSCEWTQLARSSGHRSTYNAYETTISLIQESLSFAPTLETQHVRLVSMRDQYEKLPLDYASYLVQIGQSKQAIETLEQGRCLLWSEMRGLRATIDQLHVVNYPLAEKFAAVNRDLEALITSRKEGSPVVWMEDNRVSVGKGMDPSRRLGEEQRKLYEERGRLISPIRTQPGFETFLIPPSFDTLRSAAAGGPVILINHSEWRSDIIILLHDSPPSLIPTSHNFYDQAKRLHEILLAKQNIGLDSSEYEDALSYVLQRLYDLVGRPVIEKLRNLNIPEQSRVWWCPTSVFCSLPLHAMGPIRSGGPTKLYFSDLYIPSYTPTLSALINSRQPSTQAFDKPSMLLVVQPVAQSWSSVQEMHIVRNACPSVETLFQKKATRISTLERLKHHRFAHIVSHGILETGKPFEAFFKLYEGKRLTLLDIVRSRLPTAEFAFLSACHTAELTKESIADEVLHLTAAVQYSGFRSAVGTMWAMADIDGPVVAGKFYKSVFSDRWEGVPYYERTAEALRDAVRKLRRRRKMTLERWVNYVHYGA